MKHYPRSLSNLIWSFAKLPGVGKKTAERLALHILRAPHHEAEQLAGNIMELKQRMQLCSRCFALSENNVCTICSDPIRNNGKVCVVENPSDMAAIEKSAAFDGVYHILQGIFSPMDNVGPEDIRLHELFTRIKNEKITEIIFALNTTIEGDATATYIINHLKNYDIKLTQIASGVPVGGDLKYIDPVTLRRAMETRLDTK